MLIDGDRNDPFAITCTGTQNITAYRATINDAIRCAEDAWYTGEYTEIRVTGPDTEAVYNADVMEDC